MLDGFVSLESQGLPLSVLRGGDVVRYKDGASGAGTEVKATVRVQEAVADGACEIKVDVLANNSVGQRATSLRGSLMATAEKLHVPMGLANALRKGLQKNQKNKKR